MVIDTSALVAILLREEEADCFARIIVDAPLRLVSVVTRVESSIVMEGRKGPRGGADLDLLLHEAAVEIVPVTPQQGEIAIAAYRRFGKGRHRAGLNIGDCFAYALARSTDRPLLFKGADFGHTDIIAATGAA